MRAANGMQHGCGDFSCIGAFSFPEDILPANPKLASTNSFYHRGQTDIRRAEDNLIPRMVLYQWQEGRDEVARSIGRLIHLPVGGDELFSHEVKPKLTTEARRHGERASRE